MWKKMKKMQIIIWWLDDAGRRVLYQLKCIALSIEQANNFLFKETYGYLYIKNGRNLSRAGSKAFQRLQFNKSCQKSITFLGDMIDAHFMCLINVNSCKRWFHLHRNSNQIFLSIGERSIEEVRRQTFNFL